MVLGSFLTISEFNSTWEDSMCSIEVFDFLELIDTKIATKYLWENNILIICLMHILSRSIQGALNFRNGRINTTSGNYKYTVLMQMTKNTRTEISD